jgi:hypothetical protein
MAGITNFLSRWTDLPLPIFHFPILLPQTLSLGLPCFPSSAVEGAARSSIIWEESNTSSCTIPRRRIIFRALKQRRSRYSKQSYKPRLASLMIPFLFCGFRALSILIVDKCVKVLQSKHYTKWTVRIKKMTPRIKVVAVAVCTQ